MTSFESGHDFSITAMLETLNGERGEIGEKIHMRHIS